MYQYKYPNIHVLYHYIYKQIIFKKNNILTLHQMFIWKISSPYFQMYCRISKSQNYVKNEHFQKKFARELQNNASISFLDIYAGKVCNVIYIVVIYNIIYIVVIYAYIYIYGCIYIYSCNICALILCKLPRLENPPRRDDALCRTLIFM